MALNSELNGVSAASQDVCVFISGDWHFVHMRDELCFLLYLWICTPHATSSESLLVRKGDAEYACIVWFDPEVLVLCRI